MNVDTQYNVNLLHGHREGGCQHCDWNFDYRRRRGHFYAHVNYKSTEHPDKVGKGAVVYRSTNRFQYAFNITLNHHKTTNDYETLFDSFYILKQHLQQRYNIQNVRMLLNSSLDRFGKKEHQHIWLVISEGGPDRQIFDNVFGTFEGYDTRFPNRKDTISSYPYPGDTVMEFNSHEMLDRMVRDIVNMGISFYIFIHYENNNIRNGYISYVLK
jgi:hypothetical protein